MSQIFLRIKHKIIQDILGIKRATFIGKTHKQKNTNCTQLTKLRIYKAILPRPITVNCRKNKDNRVKTDYLQRCK